jgi:hypothetical protein
VKTSTLVVGGGLVLLIGFGGLRVAQGLALGLSPAEIFPTAVAPILVIVACLAGLVAVIGLRERRAEARALALAGGSAVVSVAFDDSSMSALLRAASERPGSTRRLTQVVADAGGLSIWNGSAGNPARLLGAPWADVDVSAAGSDLHIRLDSEGRSSVFKGRVHSDFLRLAGDAEDARKAGRRLTSAQ